MVGASPTLSEPSLVEKLDQGLANLGLSTTTLQKDQLHQSLQLLVQWNKTYNLTAIRDPGQMLISHIFDCLAVVPVVAEIAPRTILDVGAGAGLPGIVLSILMPDVHVTLVDASRKKVAFLTQVKGALHLGHVTPLHARIEALAGRLRAEMVVARAFADLPKMVSLVEGSLATGGVIAAMKGVVPAEEIQRMPKPWHVRSIQTLQIPQLDAARCVVLIERMEVPD